MVGVHVRQLAVNQHHDLILALGLLLPDVGRDDPLGLLLQPRVAVHLQTSSRQISKVLNWDIDGKLSGNSIPFQRKQHSQCILKFNSIKSLNKFNVRIIAFVHFPGMSQPIYNTYTVNQKNKNKQQKRGATQNLFKTYRVTEQQKYIVSQRDESSGWVVK